MAPEPENGSNQTDQTSSSTFFQRNLLWQTNLIPEGSGPWTETFHTMNLQVA